MMYPRLLLFLGAIAGIVGLVSAVPGSPAPADETSSTSRHQPTSVDSLFAMAVETATNAPEPSPVFRGLLSMLDSPVPVISTARASTVTARGTSNSIQTGQTVSTQPWSSTHVIASTSQPVTSATTANPSSVFDSSTTSNPSSVFDYSTTSNPSSVFDSSSTSNPSSVFDSSTTSNPSSVFDSSTTSNPSSVFDSSTTSNPSSVFDSSTTSNPSSVFDSSTQSNPSSAPGSLPPAPPYSTPQPVTSASFSPILIIIVILLVAVAILVVIVFFIRRRKRSHSQTFEPQRKRKGKAEDAWAGPVALPEDGGVTEGTEEKNEEDLTSKRLSLSTFFNKRKSRAVSVLLEEVDEVGNAKNPAQEARQPLLSNGQVTDAQTPEQTQIPITDQCPGDPAPQAPGDQGLLLPPPPPSQPNGHVQGPESEQGLHDDLPPPPPLGDTAIPPPETGEGEKLDSFAVKTSL